MTIGNGPRGRRLVRRPARGIGAVLALTVLVGCAGPAGRAGGDAGTTRGPAEGSMGVTRAPATPWPGGSDPAGPAEPDPSGSTETGPGTTTRADVDGTGAVPPTAGPAGSTDLHRPGVLPSTRMEPPLDADRPDGPAPTPDDALTTVDLTGLVRQAASDPVDDQRCTPVDVRLSLTGMDAAAGHRYAQLVATNVGDRTCALRGWPGLGFRGAWGTAFPVVAEQVRPSVERVGVPAADPSTAVTLAPGGGAAAELEWTGALAGRREERMSLIAVQFGAGGDAAALPVAAGNQIDLGAETTVRIGPWGAAGL